MKETNAQGDRNQIKKRSKLSGPRKNVSTILNGFHYLSRVQRVLGLIFIIKLSSLEDKEFNMLIRIIRSFAYSILVITIIPTNVIKVQASRSYSQTISPPMKSKNLSVAYGNPRWQILVLIYKETDFTYTDNIGVQHQVIASMTQVELDRAESAVSEFFEIDVPILNNENMIPDLTIRTLNTPLSKLTSYCNFWPDPTDIASDLDPKFDSIIVIWDDSGTDVNTGYPSALHHCGGASADEGIEQTYSAIPIDSVALNQRNVFKHEWGHSILFYYDAAGTAPKPAVDNHINDTDKQYVNCETGEPYILVDESDENPIPNSIYNNEEGFTHDYFSGSTATTDQPERCLGITQEAWSSGGPVSKHEYDIFIPMVYDLRQLTTTQVITFYPDGFAGEEQVGHCWINSLVLWRPDAWRCVSGNILYDPCFSTEGLSEAVICGATPWNGGVGFKLNLTEPLPVNNPIPDGDYAWAYVLEDGVSCGYMGGATWAFDGERVNYSCSAGWFIIGDPEVGQLWKVKKVLLSSNFLPEAYIVDMVLANVRMLWQ